MPLMSGIDFYFKENSNYTSFPKGVWLCIYHIFSCIYFFQHKASRLSQEKDQLQQEKAWLEKDLKEKTDELLSLRKVHVRLFLYFYSTRFILYGCYA